MNQKENKNVLFNICKVESGKGEEEEIMSTSKVLILESSFGAFFFSKTLRKNYNSRFYVSNLTPI